MNLTYKQTEAIEYLEDNVTTECYYGGAAGGGKSALGCYWQLKRRINFPGTRGLLGRATLKALKETTLATFFEISKREGLKRGSHFDLTSAQDKEFPNCLVFSNDSLIFLKDLFAYPSDPDFDELGSLEITDAFLDECPQISAIAKNIVRSRIRYKLDEFKLIPKMLMTGNPSKNWSYEQFYKAAKEGTLTKDKKFVQALPGDNPYLPDSYIESLKGLDKNSRERLLEGNWEYDDDPRTLIEYEKILNCFSNDFEALKGEEYITVDAARLGGDRIIVGHWIGWRVKLRAFRKQRLDVTLEYVERLRKERGIPVSNVLVDDDGVGGGLVDFGNYKGFVNNGRPLPNPLTREPENYANLKSQCSFMMAERCNNNGLFIECEDLEMRKRVVQQMEQVKHWNMDKDGKKAVMPKEKVKEIIGYSPDEWDTIMMRAFFELEPEPVIWSA